jgi:hypothetical protein
VLTSGDSKAYSLLGDVVVEWHCPRQMCSLMLEHSQVVVNSKPYDFRKVREALSTVNGKRTTRLDAM